MSTKPKKQRRRNREEMLNGLGRANYEGFLGCIEGGAGQPLWEDIPEQNRIPWMVGADRAVQEWIEGIGNSTHLN